MYITLFHFSPDHYPAFIIDCTGSKSLWRVDNNSGQLNNGRDARVSHAIVRTIPDRGRRRPRRRRRSQTWRVVGPLGGPGSNKESKSNDPLLRIYPAGRKNGSTVAFNRKTIGRLNRSRLGKRKPRARKLCPSLIRSIESWIVYRFASFRSSWTIGGMLVA